MYKLFLVGDLTVKSRRRYSVGIIENDTVVAARSQHQLIVEVVVAHGPNPMGDSKGRWGLVEEVVGGVM